MIELPWPDSKLLPNRSNGKHWAGMVKAKKDAKNIAWACAMNKEPKAAKRIRLEIDFYPPDNRRRDLDGMLSSVKHYLDGVALAWQVDDVVFRPMVLDVKESVKGGKVVIRY